MTGGGSGLAPAPVFLDMMREYPREKRGTVRDYSNMLLNQPVIDNGLRPERWKGHGFEGHVQYIPCVGLNEIRPGEEDLFSPDLPEGNGAAAEPDANGTGDIDNPDTRFSSLWDQATATVALSCGAISDQLLVALARSRELWPRVVLESRVLLTMRDFDESPNTGRVEAGKKLLPTPGVLRLAQPVSHATEEGTPLKRLDEEASGSSSKLTGCGDGCSFCVEL
eukprot:g2760.t1